MSFGLKPLYDKNISYYKIIKEFRERLPRQQNRAKSLTSEEIEKHPLLDNDFKYVNVINTSTHKTTVSEVEIDLFYNKLNDFDYRFVFFRNYYKSFTRNLNRFNPKAENGNFHLIIVQKLLQDDPENHPLKPFDVFFYFIKWKFKLTSRIYVYFLNRKQNNK